MRLLTALSVLLIFSSAIYAEKIEIFEKIEFRGAKNLDRYNTIRISRAKANKKGIIIDTDSLKGVLEKNVIVKNSTPSCLGFESRHFESAMLFPKFVFVHMP